MLKLTPTQRKIYNLLSDNNRHRSREVLTSCLTEGSSMTMLHCHINRLRQKLQAKGKTVICEVVDRAAYYRLIEFPALNGNGPS